jgi:hypothetical protein
VGFYFRREIKNIANKAFKIDLPGGTEFSVLRRAADSPKSDQGLVPTTPTNMAKGPTAADLIAALNPAYQGHINSVKRWVDQELPKYLLSSGMSADEEYLRYLVESRSPAEESRPERCWCTAVKWAVM